MFCYHNCVSEAERVSSMQLHNDNAIWLAVKQVIICRKKKSGEHSIRKWLATLGLVMLVGGCTPQPHVLKELPPPSIRIGSAVVRPERLPPQPASPAPSPRPPLPMPVRSATVVVDPGHGGHDPGTQGLGGASVPEKDIVLNIANELAVMLAARGLDVIPTRNTDRFITLEGRASMADRTGADLFVSIHVDASRNHNASGMTVYISRDASAGSRQAADAIYASLRQAGFESRGIKHADFHVLAKHSRPAVLVECGYLTNPSDASSLNTAAYRSRIASAIANGIVRYLSQ